MAKINTGVGPGGKFTYTFMFCCCTKTLFPGDFIIRFFIIQSILNFFFLLSINGGGFVLKGVFAYSGYGVAAVWIGAIVCAIIASVYAKRLQDKVAEPGKKIIKAANIYNLVLNILVCLVWSSGFISIMGFGFYTIYLLYFAGVGVAAFVGFGMALVVLGCLVVPIFLISLGQILMTCDVFKAEQYLNNTNQFHL